ncbi:DUF1015 domain-containing protein [Treponema pectinovorum]|uniref:DUF1015 domain-containing protein n=1 Tax=Treponema pectinovorum TaxID=164 RepID=UPI0011CAB368|nr:DUF1015 domain-containing protein [Treponema pectinovorum]
MKTLEKYGISIPKILLPKNIDLKTWSVIACDQYTQDFDYWKKTEELTKGKPSTLNLIFPEVYLSSGDGEERIKNIKEKMHAYIKDGVFEEEQSECIYLERKTAYGRTRRGLVLCVDLDKYEWKPFSKAPIRATEATVPERIPPRMKIRNNAALELPHIMLLANDKENLLIGGAEKLAKKTSPVYDGPLMQDSGSITGWALKGKEAESLLEDAISSLAQSGTDKDGNTFLFAVGDGNHSLATAKAVWEENKQNLPKDSPVRYALVEVVNIYDTGLTFEPIHRVLFDLESDEVLDYIAKKLDGKIIEKQDEQSLEDSVAEKNTEGAIYGFIFTKNDKTSFKMLQTSIKTLAISALQPILDEYMTKKGADKTQIDYIHGTKETVNLGKIDKNIAILLPPIEKDSFFLTINENGPLPRKSFSMGEASEKRFYVESRRLF